MGNIDSKGELIPSVPKNRDKPCLRFGKFTLDPARRGLYVGANRVRLTSKPFELLVVLVEGRGQTVEKQQLLDAVWKDAFVTEDSLVKAVREIRRALDDNKGNPQFVQTVPGEGYRFIADVTVVKFNPDTRAEDLQGAESVTSEEVIERPSGKAPTTIQSRQLWNVGVAIVAFLAIALGFSLKRPSDEEPPRQDPIATFSAPYTSISVSPDGSWITFIADSDGVPQVWVKNLSGGEPFAITSGDIPSSGPRWSPKNNEIVFTRGEEAPSIWSVPPVPGQGPTLLIQAGRNPRWNTTGDRLVFERADEIWTAHADGTHQLRVEGVPEVDFLIVDRDPSFSPDGSQIAFFQPEDGPMGDIWIVPAGGGKARQLTFDNHLGGSPVWTPKGDYIVFTSQRRGSKTLWKIPSSGGSPEPVLNGPGEDTNPEIFPDGARVIYAHRQTQWILTLKDIGSGKVTELRSSVTDMFFPSFSPQGDKIAFFATVAGGDIHLFTIRIDGKELTQVTRGKGERNVFPSWSEDGMTLFFYQVRPALSFRRISASGGVSVGVADGWRWRTHNGAQVAPSGKHVIYSRLKKGETTTTLIREIESGKETVFSEALDTPRWSKDSKSILAVDAKSVHSVSEGGDVVICGLDNGLCRKIAERGASPLWSDSSRIYFDRWKSRDSREVWTVSSKGTDEQPAIELQQMDPMASSYDISSAGQVTFIQIKRSQQALWATSLK